MKSAVLSGMLLLTVIGLVILTAVLIPNEADALASECRALAPLTGEARMRGAHALEKGWQARVFLFSLVVAHAEIDSTEYELCRLCTAAEKENDDEYQLAVASLAERFTHLGDLNRFSFDGVL